MSATLEDYRSIVPAGAIEILRRLADPLQSRRVVQVTTRFGVGVVESMATRVTTLLEELGLDAHAVSIDGDERFRRTCRVLYDALQGENERVSDEDIEAYVEVNREQALGLDLEGDLVMVHDPQPAPLVAFRAAEGRWVWRSHLDLARPQRQTWAILRKYVVQYDAAVFSLPRFARRLPIRQFQIPPSIDPLSERNRELTDDEIAAVTDRLGIARDRPIVAQVARFHRLKGALNALEAARIARRQNDFQLVLAGTVDGEDEERCWSDVCAAAGDEPWIRLVRLERGDDLTANAIQRAATVVVQQSLREGFGLMVAEAMWKGRPVVGSFTGGIPSQLLYGVTGMTVHTVEGCAFRIRHLLNHPEIAEQMGRDAREFARRHLLITRHLGDYLALASTLTAS